MDERLEKILVEKYPEFFIDHGGDMKDTCMAWGCSCGDGWFGLIDDACKLIKQTVEDARKRHQLLSHFNVKAAQIKEKWGSLTIYTDTSVCNIESVDIDSDTVKKMWELATPYQDRIAGYLSMAQVYSGRVCETCGNYGRIRGGGWFHCSCDLCHGLKESGCRDDLKMRSQLRVERILNYIEEEKRDNEEMF